MQSGEVMLLPVVLFLLIVLVASARVKGPLWALAIAWLVSLVPITTGLITFGDLSDAGYGYSATLIGWNLLYVAGAAGFYYLARNGRVAGDVPASGRPPLRLAWFCWLVGMAGALCVVVDFYFYAGAGLSDLAAIRDTYTEKTSASVFAQVGSVMTWACLYCYIFVLMHRGRLGRLRSAILLLPIAGYFLVSLLSAGRQAAFQVMLVTGLTMALAAGRRHRRPRRPQPSQSALTLVAVSVAMIGYMGYVALFRNDGAAADDKTNILAALFNFQLSPTVSAIGTVAGASVRAVVVEAITYFSSSIVLFEKLLTIDLPRSFGAMSLPFILRQLQGLTGIAPADVIAHRIDALNGLGLVGNAWTTTFGSYLMDFGPYGTGLLLVASGFYSAFAWDRALRSNRFEDMVVGVLVLLAAIYLPISPAISDTNLLLLWLFCLLVGASRQSAAPSIMTTAAAA